MSRITQKPRIGLALGGGGARGWAHLGVLRALQERNVEIHAFAGTSIGSLVGGFAAAGRTDELEKLLASLDFKKILYLFAEKKIPKSGLVDGRKIIDLIRRHVGSPLIQDMPVPYCAVAADIDNGDEVVIRHGDLVSAIRASISIPGVFSPVKWEGRYLVDGGLVDPLPIEPVRSLGAVKVIAVNLHGGGLRPVTRQSFSLGATKRNAEGEEPDSGSAMEWLSRKKEKLEQSAADNIERWLSKSSEPSLFTVLGNTVDVVSTRLTKLSLERNGPDILIEPAIGNIGHMEFHRYEEGVAAGYAAAMEALDAHGERLA